MSSVSSVSSVSDDTDTDAQSSAKLSGLTIGSLTLNPEFSADVTEYTVTTTNKTNKVSATANDEATVNIILTNSEYTDETITNGSSVTWADGVNTITITVTNGNANTVYTVVVTASLS